MIFYDILNKLSLLTLDICDKMKKSMFGGDFMVEVVNIVCQIFCIAILFVLESGMILPDKSYEAKKFQDLIIADAVYVLLNICWLFIDGHNFMFGIQINYIINLLISFSQANLGVCYYRYLFYVITKKKQKSKAILIPGIILTTLSASSYWTGVLYTVDDSNRLVSGANHYIETFFFYIYLILIACVSLVKWKYSSNSETRKRASISSSLIIPPALAVAFHIIFPELTCLHSFGVTISIASVFVRLQKQSVNSNILNTEIAKENATLYRNTVLSNALQFMVVNLTNNNVEELSIPKRPDLTLQKLIDTKSITNTVYSEIVGFWSKNILDLTAEEIHYIYDSELLKANFEEGIVKVNDVFRVKKANGEISWCNQDIIMAKNEKSGAVIATITVTDITEQKHQEQAFEYQQAIVEGLAYGIPSYWIVDIETEEFIDYNVDNQRHNDIIRTEGLGINYTEFVNRVAAFMATHIDVSEMISYFSIETVRAKLSDSRQYIIPFNLKYTKEGKYFQVSYTKVYLNGKEAFILSTRDISENVQTERTLREQVSAALEKAEKASEAKSSFLFNMSHDIRTPMNAILGFNDMAVKHIDNKEKALDALNKAKYSGEHMLGIINDILDIARIENGKMKLNIDVLDVKDGFSRFDDMFSLAMKEKGIDFKVIDNTKTKYVYADYLRMSQVLSNLLSNAMKFTNPGGSVTFIVDEVEYPKDGYVGFEITIRDTGIGMSDEFQQKLFLPFERENSATVSGVQGTGLGLSIAKNLVDLMGGKITVKSKLGEGTEFKIFFDSKVVPDYENVIEEKIEDDTIIDFSGKTVLVVEDNVLNNEIVCEILEEEGFVVTSVDDGSKAVEIIEQAENIFDVVLMDIQMPIMNGYQATKKIRAMEDEKKKSVPIVAMTANAFAEDREHAFSVGMNEHVAKPLDINNLLKVLSKLLR